MSWMKYCAMGLVMLLVALLGACSGGGNDDAEDGGPGEIGGVCGADSDCKGGKCAAAGVCTRACSLHSECGCAPNTTNQDIIDGDCSVACVLDSCARTCKTSLECHGSTDCQATDSYFSVCL
jgi:hypothetical protein